MAAESAATETVDKKDGNEESVELKEEEEAAPVKKIVSGEEEDVAAEEGEEVKDNLDDDQNVENPAYIPKTGRFYMHDDNRRGDVVIDHDDDEDRKNLKKSRADGEWKHDRFDEKFQRPKTKKQIMTKYGFDIRHKEGEEEKETTAPESTEGESSDARAARPHKDRRVSSSSGRGGRGGVRRPMKQREREDTVDESEGGRGEEEEEPRPAQKRQVKHQEKTRKPKQVTHSSEDGEEEDEKDDDETLRRGQRRTIPVRRGAAGPTARLRGRMSHPMAPPRRPSSGHAPSPRDPRETRNQHNQNEAPRREYSARHDDRFENHRRGVIRGASRGVTRGYSRGSSVRGGSRGAPRFQGSVRRTDTSEQSEGYQRGSGTDYSSPRPQHHQSAPVTNQRGSSSYQSNSYRNHSHPSNYSRGNFSNGSDYVPRGGFHGPKRFNGPPVPAAPAMVAVGVANVVPPPQMTRGATHGHNGGGGQRIRQPTDVVYFDPQQQQGSRQLPQRSKKVIPIVDPNKSDAK